MRVFIIGTYIKWHSYLFYTPFCICLFIRLLIHYLITIQIMDLIIKILINKQSHEKYIEMCRCVQICFLVFKKVKRQINSQMMEKHKKQEQKKSKEQTLTVKAEVTLIRLSSTQECVLVIWPYPRGDGPYRGCRSVRRTLQQLLCCAVGIRWLWPCTQERLQSQRWPKHECLTD